jgi:membrane protease YdiL (CAAX protease family)
MQANTETAGSQPGLTTRVAAAWLLGLVGLLSAGFIGEQLVATYGITPRLRYALQAAIMSGIVLSGIWWLRRSLDRRPLAGLAILGWAKSLKGFALGSGLMLGPFVVTLLCAMVFGWATLTINPAPGALTGITVGILTAFFFEALPEELMYRGYIYRNLNTTMRRWTAGLVTIALFTLLPVALDLIQRHVLKMPVQIGASDHITGGYLLTMTLFGTFLQYLRVLSGTVWACIGFHLFFLMASRIAGIQESSFILLSDFTNERPMQMVLVGSILLVFIALLAFPRFSGRSLGWGTVDPE